MKNNTHIIVLGVSKSFDRTTLEKIEGETFNSPDHIRSSIDPDGEAEIGIYSLSEFMDACNNTDSEAEEEAINIGECWIGYVEIEEQKETPNYILKEDGIHVVGSHKVVLSDKIREEDLHEYSIVDRESMIDDLYRWIGEAKDDCYKQMMKDDLRMLEEWEDDYIFSSNSTNSYINSEGSDFDQTCKELIDISESL